MSELINPLFEEEKEFLEHKKLEYERALRGDVEQIKEKSVQMGKVAAIGAGVVGGIWLISKAFGGKKKKKRKSRPASQPVEDLYGLEPRTGPYNDEVDGADYEPGARYFTSGLGKRYKSKIYQPTDAGMHGFGSGEDVDDEGRPYPAVGALDSGENDSYFDAPAAREDDPFQDLPYDDSRRLHTSHSYDAELEDAPAPAAFRAKNSPVALSLLKGFLESSTGKMLVAQAAAVALAVVTKKVGEIFPSAPTDKNADLAASSGHAPAAAGNQPASAALSDAFVEPANPA